LLLPKKKKKTAVSYVNMDWTSSGLGAARLNF